jgi:hypothetical protein
MRHEPHSRADISEKSGDNQMSNRSDNETRNLTYSCAPSAVVIGAAITVAEHEIVGEQGDEGIRARLIPGREPGLIQAFGGVRGASRSITLHLRLAPPVHPASAAGQPSQIAESLGRGDQG